MSNQSQLSFFDEEPSSTSAPPPSKPKERSSRTAKSSESHQLSAGAKFILSKAFPGYTHSTPTGQGGDDFESDSPFVSGEYDEPFEVIEPVAHQDKSNKAKPQKKETQAPAEGLEEPLPFKPKRDYSKYVVYTPLNQDILVYQWAVKVLPNPRMLQWFQENPNRVGNPLRWDAAFDLLRKMAHREAPWELLDKIEEETGLNKRDLADALAYSDALAIIRGSDNQDSEPSFMSAFSF